MPVRQPIKAALVSSPTDPIVITRRRIRDAGPTIPTTRPIHHTDPIIIRGLPMPLVLQPVRRSRTRTSPPITAIRSRLVRCQRAVMSTRSTRRWSAQFRCGDQTLKLNVAGPWRRGPFAIRSKSDFTLATSMLFPIGLVT